MNLPGYDSWLAEPYEVETEAEHPSDECLECGEDCLRLTCDYCGRETLREPATCQDLAFCSRDCARAYEED